MASVCAVVPDTPISELGAHPVYNDPGEIPIGGRGTVGTTASNYQLDLHADYPLQLGERYKIKFTFDTFNVTNSRSLTAVDQDIALSYGVTRCGLPQAGILPACFLWARIDTV